MADPELVRMQLDLIYEAFPDRPQFISLNAASKFLGVDVRTLQADARFPMKKSGNRSFRINLLALANWMLREVKP